MMTNRLTYTLCLAVAIFLVSQRLYAQSEIKWLDGTVCNFGRINEADGCVSHRFVLKNVSKESFRIVRAAGHCDCTTVSYVERDIAPGDTASVVVAFNPANQKGQFYRRVTVLLSGPSLRNTLFIKGDVVPKGKDREDTLYN